MNNKHDQLAKPVLQQILGPVQGDAFFASYWEKQPLHIDRSDAQHFTSLVSEPALRTVMRDHPLSFPDVQATNAHKDIRVADFTDSNKHIVPEKLLSLHKDGATLIFSRAHVLLPALQKFCLAVTRELNMRSQANVYLSPPGNQGFRAHYDTHDVFVLQAAGSKTFRFYASDIALPFTDDTFEPDANSDTTLHEEITLTAGDTLYIPRGVVHDAVAHGEVGDSDESSLHITLGVFPFVVRDLLQELVQVAAEKDIDLRRSVHPLNTNTNNHNVPGSEKLLEMLRGVCTADTCNEALSRLSDEIAIESISTNSPEALSDINPDTWLDVCSELVFGTEHYGDQLKLRVAGSVVTVGAPYDLAIETLLENGSMQVKALSGLTNEQQLALAQQLIHSRAVTVRL